MIHIYSKISKNRKQTEEFQVIKKAHKKKTHFVDLPTDSSYLQVKKTNKNKLNVSHILVPVSVSQNMYKCIPKSIASKA